MESSEDEVEDSHDESVNLEARKIKERDQDTVAASKKAAQEVKAYDRKATDSKYQEELDFNKFRMQKVADLGKREKHLSIFSSSNILSFKDMGRSDIAKAWAVLFHFKNKSQDSLVYDLFFSDARRNALGKLKNHKQFQETQRMLRDVSHSTELLPKAGQKCPNSGHPIDLLLMPNVVSNRGDKLKKVAISFLLQEEIAKNLKTGKEEPLGFQKLMLSQLSV